jgi:AraC-like DNA-binding protein
MYDQIREDMLYMMLYAVVTATAVMASCYLLFRRGNAFAPDITTPIRLRRWTAAFFAILALNHLWYMPILFLSSSEDIVMIDLIGGLFDCMTLFPVAIIVLFAMLQDRRRPLWHVAVMMTPIVVVGAFNVATRSYALQPMVYVYSLLMCIGLIIYMVRALRRYGRWLRDNFADLEHKEVWQSFIVLAIIMLVFAIYVFTSEGPVFQYAMQMIILVLIFYLLWRVETLSDLSIQFAPAESEASDYQSSSKDLLQANRNRSTLVALPANIGVLLQQHCIDTQLYLQHDLNLSQLAKAIGTNRLYLTQYFSTQGTTYNAFINDLRINHFMSLYCEAVAARRSLTAQQLASESGYQSYSTFRHAFKLKMGQNVREWMSDSALKWQN